MKILIRGGATVDGGGSDLNVLDGVDSDACFSEYFHEQFTVGDTTHPGEQALIDAGVTGGFMHFECLDNELFVVTEYDLKRKLTEAEEKQLIEYTQGQWSDGIGEGFEQNPLERDGYEYYISAWYPGQVATAEYSEED